MLICKLATLVAFSTAAINLVAAPTFATLPESGSHVVNYDDLDLSTAAGVRVLHHRIAAALESVCGSYAGTDTIAAASENDEITKCRAATRAQVDQRLAAILSAHARMASAR